MTRCQASNVYGRVVSTLVHVRGVVEEALVIRSLSQYHFLSLWLLFISRNLDSELCSDPQIESLCNTSFRKTNISFSHCLDTNIVVQSCGGASVEVEHRNPQVPGKTDDQFFNVASITTNL